MMTKLPSRTSSTGCHVVHYRFRLIHLVQCGNECSRRRHVRGEHINVRTIFYLATVEAFVYETSGIFLVAC